MLFKKSKTSSHKVVAVSGYFNPLHIGHIDLFYRAKKLGDELIVIVNNDEQTRLKYGKVFMLASERAMIIAALRVVDKVIVSIDRDRTIRKTLELLNPDIFANGGDRTLKNIPEAKICKRLGIKMVFNLGGKLNSSSDLLKNYENTHNRSR